MLHLASNIPPNTYFASRGSEILRLARNTSDINTFVTFSNRYLQRMKGQEIKYRSIIFMLNKIISMKNFSVFDIVSGIAATIHIHVCFLHSLFLFFVVLFFVFFLFGCLFLFVIIMLLLLLC